MLLYPILMVLYSKQNDLAIFVVLVVKLVVPSQEVDSHQIEIAITIIERFEHQKDYHQVSELIRIALHHFLL